MGAISRVVFLAKLCNGVENKVLDVATSVVPHCQDYLAVYAAQAAEVSRIVSTNLSQIVSKGRNLRTGETVSELADALSYLIDTCATLASLLTALPAAAPVLLEASESPHLLICLAHVHDLLVPSAAAVARTAPASLARDLVLSRQDRVRLVVARGAYLLLVHGLLDVESLGGSCTEDTAVELAERLLRLLMALQVHSPSGALL
jgi:hypothetical protein